MKIVIRLAGTLVVLSISIFGTVYFHANIYEIFLALFSCGLAVQIEILLNRRKRLAEIDRVATLYRSLRQSKCPLIKILVESKYAETYGFFENLNRGRMPLADDTAKFSICCSTTLA